MPRKVSPARLGIVDQETWDELIRLQEEDWDKFIEQAIVACYDNVSLFNYLFLNFGPTHAPTPHFEPVWEAMEEYDKLLVELPRSHSKCLSEDQEVLLSDGSWAPIKEVSPGDTVVSFDKLGNLTKDTVVDKTDSGEKSLFRVETAGGLTLEASADHRILTFEGWKKISEITTEDYIASPRRIPEPEASPSKLDVDDAALLAVYIAEGSKTSGSFRFCNTNEKIVERIRQAANNKGWEFKETSVKDHYIALGDGRHTGNNPLPFLREHDLKRARLSRHSEGFVGVGAEKDSTTHNVRVPEAVYRSPREVVSEFLSVIFACDGCVAQEARQIGYTSASRMLVLDISRLLLRFGVCSNVVRTKVKYKGEYRTFWSLTISGTSHIEAFDKHIGMVGKQNKLNLLCEQVNGSANKNRWDMLPPPWKEHLTSPKLHHREDGRRVDNNYRTTRRKVRACAEFEDNDYLLSLVDNDLSWLRVSNIEESGLGRTFDIETKKHHNFVAERMVVHNSASLMGKVVHDICYHHIGADGYEDISILLVQESGGEALDTVQSIKDILEQGGTDGLIAEAFCQNQTFEENAKRWARDAIWLRSGALSKDPTLKGVGVEGAQQGKHSGLLLFDDVVSSENSETAYKRRKLWRNFRKTFRDIIDVGSQFVSLYTPKYEGDLNDRLSKTGIYKHIRFPALNRVPSRDDYEVETDADGTVTGIRIHSEGTDLEALWPCPLGTGNCPMTERHMREYGEHRPVEDLLLRHYEDPIGFMENQMLELGAGEDARVAPDMLRFFVFPERNPSLIGKVPEEYGENQEPIVAFPDPDDITLAVHAWDHAIGQKKQHADTAFARLYRTNNNDVFIICDSDRWHPNHVLEMMETNYLTDPFKTPRKVVTEAINFQQLFAEMAKDRADDLRFVADIEEVKTNKDKDEALVQSGLLALMGQGKVYVDYNDKETINQLLSFTPDAKGKVDRVDAIRLGYTWMSQAGPRKVRAKRIGGGQRKRHRKIR